MSKQNRRNNRLAGLSHILYNRVVSGTFRFTRGFPALIIVMFFIAGALFARQASWIEGKSSPEDLVIQLVTIEPGDELYTWWGHAAIIVTDTRLNESRFYNYGLFSFQQTNFAANFAMGRLWFEVGAYTTRPAMEQYKRLNRSILVQTLNMPPEMKLQIARFVETNILPENKTYLYDHYYDNCATRLRDILDMASGGRLKKATDLPAGTTFRQITRRFSGHNTLMDTLLMFLMGSVIDDPISVWETMFLPVELAEAVDQISIPGSDGEMAPFVSSTTLWHQSTGREPIPDHSPPAIPFSLGIGCGIGLLIAFGYLALRKRIKGRRIFFGITSAIAGLILGLPGTILALMLLFTDHTVTYANENLALANPLTFLALPLGILTAIGIKRDDKLTAWLWFVLAGISILYIILKPFPFLLQNNWQIIALILPILAALVFSGWRQLKSPIDN
jgi:hypothetical protein